MAMDATFSWTRLNGGPASVDAGPLLGCGSVHDRALPSGWHSLPSTTDSLTGLSEWHIVLYYPTFTYRLHSRTHTSAGHVFYSQIQHSFWEKIAGDLRLPNQVLTWIIMVSWTCHLEHIWSWETLCQFPAGNTCKFNRLFKDLNY